MKPWQDYLIELIQRPLSKEENFNLLQRAKILDLEGNLVYLKNQKIKAANRLSNLISFKENFLRETDWIEDGKFWLSPVFELEEKFLKRKFIYETIDAFEIQQLIDNVIVAGITDQDKKLLKSIFEFKCAHIYERYSFFEDKLKLSLTSLIRLKLVRVIEGLDDLVALTNAGTIFTLTLLEEW